MFSNKLKTKHSNSRTVSAKCLSWALTATLLIGGIPHSGASTQTAWAEDIDTNVTADAAQQEVERTAAEYDQAMQRVEELNQQISDTEQRIDELEENLPAQRERSKAACVKLYKAQANTPGLMELILGSQSITEFLEAFEYVTHIFNSNQAEINRLSEMKAELEDTKQSLDQAKKDADAEAENAEAALSAAQAAREEAQRKAQEEAARQAAEAAAAAEAAEAAKKEAEEAAAKESAEAEASSSDASSDSGNAGGISAPSNDNADWSSDKATFVSEWSGRIDAYLSGSPLAGTGETFAEAAWDYGVDPRWSPAISNTESSKGLYCFASHNAWGWGSESWDNWEDAIRDHVAGLARGYGYTISVTAAKKYCPPNWEHWYNATSAQMDMI